MVVVSSETMHLREMGLSEYEAKAYVGLLQHGTSTAKEVASSAEIPQSRVYDILDSLETKGFVKVQPGRPKKFGSVEPETAIERFCAFKRRKQTSEREEIRTLGESFAETVADESYGQANQEADIGWSYPNRHHILERLESLSEDVDDEILMVTTPKSFERILNHHGSLLEAKAADGTEIRAIVADDSPINEAVREQAQTMMDIRYVEDISGRLYMYDGVDILLAYRARNDDGYVGISTASGHLYATLQQLFELLWADGVALADP
jgi:sugar-specific transcriptional regulator TrmB